MAGAKQQPLLEMAVASTANMTSGVMFNCFDVTRMRLQIQDGLGQPGKYRGMAHCIQTIVREEGLFALWSPGLGAAVARELFYGGFQFGAYGPIKQAIGGDDTLGKKILAACGCGASAALVGCPTDVVKVRLQCESGRLDPVSGRFVTGLYVGKRPQYRNSFDAVTKIFAAEGVGGFYRGVSPTVIRAVALSAGLLVSYDSFKGVVKTRGLADEGLALHVVGGLVSGLCAATTAAPWDLVKTRVQNDAIGRYRGALHCLTQTVRHEGVMALYKGWFSLYLRLGPAVVVQVPMIEFGRKAVGYSAFGVVVD